MPGILFWKQLFWKEKIKWDDDEFVSMVQCMGWKLYTCLIFRVRYHAARGLIYLGCFDVGGIYLFKRVPGKTMRRDRTVIRDKEWWCCVVWAVNQLSDDFGDWHWCSGERELAFLPWIMRFWPWSGVSDLFCMMQDWNVYIQIWKTHWTWQPEIKFFT